MELKKKPSLNTDQKLKSICDLLSKHFLTAEARVNYTKLKRQKG